jgi:hypothetical protein
MRLQEHAGRGGWLSANSPSWRLAPVLAMPWLPGHREGAGTKQLLQRPACPVRVQCGGFQAKGTEPLSQVHLAAAWPSCAWKAVQCHTRNA